MVENENNTELVKHSSNAIVKVNSFDDFKSFEDMELFAQKIVATGFTPLKESKHVIAALLHGKELGLQPMQSVNNIYPINGVATVGVHIITALLLKAGISFEVLEDYIPLYRFMDNKGNFYSEEEVTGKREYLQLVTSATPSTQIDASKVQVVLCKDRIETYRTSIKFTRKLKETNQSITVSRTMNDYKHLWLAKAQGGQEKANWNNNPKGMLYNRVISTGGKAIGDDVILGLYLTEEMQDIEIQAELPIQPHIVIEEVKE